MKNHKGQVATLLTLGLVIVGSLITLGSSLFINNNKTNLASNTRAANPCTKCTCTTFPNNSCWKKASGYWKSEGCYGEEDGYGNVCNTNRSGGSISPTIPPADDGGTSGNACEFTTPLGCTNSGCSSANCSTSGCGDDERGRQTYKCLSDSGGTDGGDTTGDEIAREGQACCFTKKDKVYVYASYDSMVVNDMLDDAGNPDCARQSAGVISSYGADPRGAFACDGGIANETPIDDVDDSQLHPNDTNYDVVVPDGCVSNSNPAGTCVSSSMYSNPYTDNDNNWCCKDDSGIVPTIVPTTKPACELYKFDFDNNGTKENYYKSTSSFCATSANTDSCYGVGTNANKPCNVMNWEKLKAHFLGIGGTPAETLTPSASDPNESSSKPMADLMCKNKSKNNRAYCLTNKLSKCANGYVLDPSFGCDYTFGGNNSCCIPKQAPNPPPPAPTGLSTFSSDCQTIQTPVGNGNCLINCSSGPKVIKCD